MSVKLSILVHIKFIIIEIIRYLLFGNFDKYIKYR
jgi:hypothetical protein